MSQQINLYTPIFLKREKYFSARTMLQALGLVVVALGSFYAFAQYETRALEDLVAAQRAELGREQGRVLQLSRAGSGELLAHEAKRLEGEIAARRRLLAMLQGGAFGNRQGIARYFAAFGRAAVPGVWLTGFTLDGGGDELEIRGRVLRPELIPVYLNALNAQPEMRGRQVVDLKLTAKERPAPAAGAQPAPGPRRYVEFSLAAPLRAAPPAAGGVAKAGAR